MYFYRGGKSLKTVSICDCICVYICMWVSCIGVCDMCACMWYLHLESSCTFLCLTPLRNNLSLSLELVSWPLNPEILLVLRLWACSQPCSTFYMDAKDVDSIPLACEAHVITQSAISLAKIDHFIVIKSSWKCYKIRIRDDLDKLCNSPIMSATRRRN